MSTHGLYSFTYPANWKVNPDPERTTFDIVTPNSAEVTVSGDFNVAPLASTSAALTTYNRKIPGIVQSRAAKGQHIIGVDMSKMPLSELSNGTHPTDQGYAHMASIWYTAIADLLPK